MLLYLQSVKHANAWSHSRVVPSGESLPVTRWCAWDFKTVKFSFCGSLMLQWLSTTDDWPITNLVWNEAEIKLNQHNFISGARTMKLKQNSETTPKTVSELFQLTGIFSNLLQNMLIVKQFRFFRPIETIYIYIYIYIYIGNPNNVCRVFDKGKIFRE